MNDDTLKIQGARFILTVDPERKIIRDGSILIRGNRIVQIGKAEEMAEVPAGRTIDAREMVVTPGFCNGHMHISYAHATRGVFPDDLGPEYLPNVFQLQGAMTEKEEYHTSLLGITELLKYGTTCFLDPGKILAQAIHGLHGPQPRTHCIPPMYCLCQDLAEVLVNER